MSLQQLKSTCWTVGSLAGATIRSLRLEKVLDVGLLAFLVEGEMLGLALYGSLVFQTSHSTIDRSQRFEIRIVENQGACG